MPNYPKMYAILCAAASEAIDRVRSGRQRRGGKFAAKCPVGGGGLVHLCRR